MLSGIANATTTNAILGYDTSWSDIFSVMGGSAIGSAIPFFKGANGGKLANGLAEIGYKVPYSYISYHRFLLLLLKASSRY